MKKATRNVMIASAVGAAAAAAYSSMRPSAKREIKKDFRKAVSHVDGVKEDLGDVRKDMTEMAKNLRNQM